MCIFYLSRLFLYQSRLEPEPKGSRSRSFCADDADFDVLFDLVCQHKDAIESTAKTRDANCKRQAAWEAVASDLNAANCGATLCSAAQLKKNWADLKRAAKRHWSSVKKSRDRQRRGPPDVSDFSDMELKVIGLLGLEVQFSDGVIV